MSTGENSNVSTRFLSVSWDYIPTRFFLKLSRLLLVTHLFYAGSAPDPNLANFQPLGYILFGKLGHAKTDYMIKFFRYK